MTEPETKKIIGFGGYTADVGTDLDGTEAPVETPENDEEPK